jgi:hypothetical protein
VTTRLVLARLCICLGGLDGGDWKGNGKDLEVEIVWGGLFWDFLNWTNLKKIPKIRLLAKNLFKK